MHSISRFTPRIAKSFQRFAQAVAAAPQAAIRFSSSQAGEGQFARFKPLKDSFVAIGSPGEHVARPVEVTIIGTLPKGVGDAFIQDANKKQRAHPLYVDEFNEESARICDTNFPGEVTAVYTFSVAKKPLVFHRHEGHRAITGITGSAGAELRFSAADRPEAFADEKAFLDQLFVVDIPADTMFMLRFNGMVYHQFCTKDPKYDAFFAVSVHTNEAGGDLAPEILEKVLKNEGDIPLLTEPIPSNVDKALEDHGASIWSKAERFVLH